MKTQRQLARSTLFELGNQLLNYQIGLKLIESDRHMVESDLVSITEAEARQRALIASVHRKINWEIKNNAEHLDDGLTNGKSSTHGALDDDEGEEWKRATPDSDIPF